MQNIKTILQLIFKIKHKESTLKGKTESRRIFSKKIYKYKADIGSKTNTPFFHFNTYLDICTSFLLKAMIPNLRISMNCTSSKKNNYLVGSQVTLIKSLTFRM